MPHLTMEYSANLKSRLDMQGLADTILEAMLATGLFETGAIRVRAIACDSYAIADRHPDNAFVDLSLRVGVGRTEADRKRAGDAIYAAASHYLTDLFETPHFALSFEIREIHPVLNWKTNAMHPRLRAAAAKE